MYLSVCLRGREIVRDRESYHPVTPSTKTQNSRVTGSQRPRRSLAWWGSSVAGALTDASQAAEREAGGRGWIQVLSQGLQDST